MAPGGSPPGVTRTTLTVSFLGGFSGAYGSLLQQAYDQGFDTWIRDVNARGGIYGRRVIAKVIDHKESADGGVGACRETLGNGSFVAIIGEGQGEGNTTAGSCLDKAGFTNLAYQSEMLSSWRHSFLMLPTGVSQGRTLASFVKNAMGDGRAKLGVIHLTVPSAVSGAEAYLREARRLGMNVVDVEKIEPNQGSFTPQLLHLKNADVTNVAIIATIESLGIWRDAAALDYHPHWTGFNWTYDVMTQGARNTAIGARGLAQQATTESPGYRAWQAKARAYGKQQTLASTAALLYAYGLLLEKGLRAAGPNPTRQSLEEGLEGIHGYDNQLLAPITYGPGRHDGTYASFPVICCRDDYSLKALGPARERF